MFMKQEIKGYSIENGDKILRTGKVEDLTVTLGRGVKKIAQLK